MDAPNAGFVEAWKRAGPMLDQVRRDELRNVDLAAELARLTDAFKIALRTNPPSMTSGLVEQQRWFMKGLRRCNR